MNLDDLRFGRFNSPFGRSLLSGMFKPGRDYRLPFGPLRGRRLHYDKSVNFHAMLGLWESETFFLIHRIFVKSKVLAKDSVIADVGANIGYYSLWFRFVASPDGHVYAFEPSPSIISMLEKNLSLNGASNITVVPSACGDKLGYAEFFIASHHHASSLNSEWASGGGHSPEKISVEMTTLDEFFDPKNGRAAPSFMKFDIEGGGVYALPGCEKVFAEHRPFVYIESHTEEEDRAISNVLTRHSYSGFRTDNRNWVKNKQNTHPDPDGVWGSLILIPDEKMPAMLQIIDNI